MATLMNACKALLAVAGMVACWVAACHARHGGDRVLWAALSVTSVGNGLFAGRHLAKAIVGDLDAA